MDTSEEYILMCKKAKEIQKLWNHERGDFFVREKEYYRDTPFVIDFHKKIFNAHWFKKDEKFIWLPRQDQLQGIIIKLYEDNTEKDDYQIRYKRELLNWMINSFDSFVKQNVGKPYKSNDSYPDNLESMEQLWLAFVMKEKYQKTWNGKDWEKNV
ncbi:hypothetical protein LCGC14_1648460 [marine sediment metagenome]|uniref:Uncharacterized protein n=1 Tax=marine sediment metagenome TaxID=412755 RepID=A0A0F9IK34_9ZZZZ